LIDGPTIAQWIAGFRRQEGDHDGEVTTESRPTPTAAVADRGDIDPGWPGSEAASAAAAPGGSAPAAEAHAPGGGAGRPGRLDPGHTGPGDGAHEKTTALLPECRGSEGMPRPVSSCPGQPLNAPSSPSRPAATSGRSPGPNSARDRSFFREAAR